MNNKKVSVIMGIYNCASTLPEAIDSILEQTYTNWELIMCDDASTDNTYEVAKQYQEKTPDKIIVLQNEKNSKLAYSLNRCLTYATGELIARMDGDDKCSPVRFERQVQYLSDHPEFQVVGTSMQRFDDEGNWGCIVHGKTNPDYYSMKNGGCPFCHATIMMRKTAYDILGGYTVSEKTSRCEDVDLWFRFYFSGFQGNNIHEPLYFVRENYNAITRRTALSRLRSMSVRLSGYKLLGYPSIYRMRIILISFLKICTPYGVQKIYRQWQNKRYM